MGVLVTPNCPGCKQPPAFVFDDGKQCVCSTVEGCKVIFWDATLTIDEMLDGLAMLDDDCTIQYRSGNDPCL
jgi:hypothetical protein